MIDPRRNTMAAVRFTPSVETPAPDEAETIDGLIAAMTLVKIFF